MIPTHPQSFRTLVLVFLFLTGSLGQALAQPALVPDEALMAKVMPGADSFSAKEGEPPVYRAYKTGSDGQPQLLGYLFETSDLPPEEVGYSAPIDVLVGIDLQGTLTGIQVLYYRESYRSIRGDFLATERFPNQFAGKSIAEGFRVGRDVDGVSRATITSWAVSRGIRNAARRVAQAYLADAGVVVEAEGGASALAALQGMSWEDMLAAGYVNSLETRNEDGSGLQLFFAYIGNDELAEMMIGADDYSRAERDASSRTQSGQMMLVGILGESSKPFRPERLAVQQGETTYAIDRRQFVYAGSGMEGKIQDQVRFAGAMVMDDAIDISQPLTIIYDNSDALGAFLNLASVSYQLPEVALAQVQGLPYPAGGDEDAYALGDFEDENAMTALFRDAPWLQVGALLVLFTLVMTAFLRKNATLRWVALGSTLAYLGFIDGGFLSVSHVLNGIKVGPSMFLNDLPVLMIVSFTLITTLLWGRVFCSSLCPFGALQDFLTRLVPRRFQIKVPQLIHDRAIYIKYGILGLLILLALVQADVSYFQYFEPFGTVFFWSPSVLLWAILIGFLLASGFIKRFYCRYACPLGATLGVIALVSPWRIRRVPQCDICTVCEHACPTGAIRGPAIDFKECVRCDVCEAKLIARSGVCKHNMDTVKSRIKNWDAVPVMVQAGGAG
ncbi:MAG: hypothetical protein RLZZ385_2119 [Pseudomonadota bacterium]|jgi:Na+-translocating ferredoxin:NAD+ oxidoreductase RnfG subunit/ferredoxin